MDEINKGNEPFPGEAFLDEKLKKLVPAGKLTATTDYSQAIPGADAIVLVVPLFVNDETWEPDFGWMENATKSLAEHLTPGTLISYETTLPVGTTRNRWKPMIEEISGLSEGKDFHLVFSPERVLTGRVFADLRRYPKLVGGLNDEALPRASTSTSKFSTSTTVTTFLAPTASGTWAPLRLLRWPNLPKPPTVTSISAWPISSASTLRPTASTSTRSLTPATRSPTPTFTVPALPSEVIASPSTRASTCGPIRTPPSSALPARPT
ncbi:UDP-N-acetyl-D-mannosaminuronic acid dehydrogenase [Cutibacterium acnes JCM 18909]|nr:UDP-N-acetyl-D-mannosaminuronic acid dehydrogenase [Cutibacterium acnes JCM 18909]